MSSLLGYNLTLTEVPIPGTSVKLAPTEALGSRGPAYDVTSELSELTLVQLVDIQGLVTNGQAVFKWSGEPEYDTGPLGLDDVIDPNILTAMAKVAEVEDLTLLAYQNSHIQGTAMSGDMALELVAGKLTMNAEVLNGAAAGKAKVHVIVALRDFWKRTHNWANLDLTMVPAENVVDPEVGVPTIDPTTVKLREGRAEFDLIFDTDAGATKTYASGDDISVTAQVAADDKLLGHTVDPVTATITVP